MGEASTGVCWKVSKYIFGTKEENVSRQKGNEELKTDRKGVSFSAVYAIVSFKVSTT